jgi:glycosyltransferase involved in cell wall biosynthesis
MRLSVIITTYNQPEWLEKVLWGYAVQQDRDFEILVADDGSDERTADVIGRLRAHMPGPLLHIWHEDNGFRKCVILNRGILEASGDALVFTDGDCIPRRDFLSVHRRLMRPGRFLSGGYAKLSMETSRLITRSDIEAGRATDAAWLIRHGTPASRAVLRLAVPGGIAAALDAVSPTRASFNGHNASVWKTDAVAVNGFDERMGWGGLDREFGERLVNAGIRGLRIRHRAHVVHLDHPRGYRKPSIEAANRAIRDEVALSKRARTAFGIARG